MKHVWIYQNVEAYALKQECRHLEENGALKHEKEHVEETTPFWNVTVEKFQQGYWNWPFGGELFRALIKGK